MPNLGFNEAERKFIGGGYMVGIILIRIPFILWSQVVKVQLGTVSKE